ncbi:c-type cytochrome [Billgrantia kenyensis]|uniref:Cytochrome c, class I n=1 Tax=Billgrantia kenyensis TaxID=321266 RepID=A0A7V9VZN8_9GAMM|nr:cytochrome c, class I [Halomonas kenyensis]MBA2778292.1 cytochrome c, class I [Halomonas kenyensis]MCG6660599.1 cytochrome c, class I [Halomonas kenyensis]
MNRSIRRAVTPIMGTLLSLGAATTAVAETNLSSEQVGLLASACANCHGTDGRRSGSVPTIAGRPAAVLESRLLAFKHEETSDTTIMDRIAKGFTDEELVALAGHFAAIDPEAEGDSPADQEPQE